MNVVSKVRAEGKKGSGCDTRSEPVQQPQKRDPAAPAAARLSPCFPGGHLHRQCAVPSRVLHFYRRSHSALAQSSVRQFSHSPQFPRATPFDSLKNSPHGMDLGAGASARRPRNPKQCARAEHDLYKRPMRVARSENFRPTTRPQCFRFTRESLRSRAALPIVHHLGEPLSL